MKKCLKKSGYTMIEATIAMVILAIAAAGILFPFSKAAAVQAEGARQTLAANLATELMEKVLMKKDQMTDPNDFVGDDPVGYNGYIEADGALLDSKEDVLIDSIYSGFSRSVICQAATVASVDLVEVTVSVSYEGREITRITTLVSK